MEQYEQQHTELLAKYGKSFYWAGLFLNRQQLTNAQKIYAFCRYVDDLADETTDKHYAINNIKAIKNEITKGESNNVIVSELLELMKKYHISTRTVFDLIEGVSWDIDHHQIQDEAQLIRYSYCVASTVGLLMCAIFEVTDPKALSYAIDLGIAMQLTNIARDVKEDALKGRIYLPQTWFKQGITPAEILSGKHQQLIYNNVQKIISMNEVYYRSADYGMAYLPWRSRLSILVASRLYEAIGRKAMRLGCKQYWETNRIYTTKLNKITLSLTAITQLFFDTKYYKKNVPHNAQLHKYIEDYVSHGEL